MTKAGEQNHLDLAEIVNEVNRAFTGSVSFVFLSADVADDGSRAAYAVVRGELDRLNLPWCAIIGDHDANDGKTLYSATRSTGQIEEGPVGYSVTNIDGDVISWRFVELGRLPVVVITSPSDERLLTGSNEMPRRKAKVRAKFWGEAEAVHATAYLDGHSASMKRIDGSHVWKADVSALHDGVHSLKVSVEDIRGKIGTDEIRVVSGDLAKRERLERDRDNALEAWPEHGLLGTQLGPNKNGKKW